MGWGVCERALKLQASRKGLSGKAKAKTGIGKTDLPGACPGKAGASSGGQTHRGKSQEPRSLDSGEKGNRISKTYRQSHRQDGEQVIGP
jgi:hypothetical protein